MKAGTRAGAGVGTGMHLKRTIVVDFSSSGSRQPGPGRAGSCPGRAWAVPGHAGDVLKTCTVLPRFSTQMEEVLFWNRISGSITRSRKPVRTFLESLETLV